MTLARTLDDPRDIGESLVNLGVLSYRRGEYGQAEERLEEAIDLLRETSRTDPATVLSMVRALLILGDTALVQEQFERAAARYTEALDHSSATGMDWGMTDIQAGLAGATFCRGDMSRAVSLYAESLTRAQEALDVESLARIQDRSFTPLVLSALLGLAGIAAEMGDPEQGARLFGAAEAITASHGIPLFPRDLPVRKRSLTALRTALGEHQLTAAREMGQTLTIEQAVVEAKAMARSSSKEF